MAQDCADDLPSKSHQKINKKSKVKGDTAKREEPEKEKGDKEGMGRVWICWAVKPWKLRSKRVAAMPLGRTNIYMAFHFRGREEESEA